MSFADGAAIINGGIQVLKIPFDDAGSNLYNIMVDVLFFSIISWWIARMIKGKGHSEASVQRDDIPEPSDPYAYDQGENPKTGQQDLDLEGNVIREYE